MPNYPRREGSKCKKERHENNILTDFTVQDFANSPSTNKTWRLRKAERNPMSSPAKVVKCIAKSTEDLPWYERDLSDLDLSPEEDQSEEHSQDTTNQARCVSERGRRRGKQACDRDEGGGTLYPLDFWLLLGDYIHPQDTLLFALICRASHMVTHTAGFWQRLYKRCRCVDKPIDLPWDLSPSHMDRVHGLRSRVIRYLYLTHPVFVNRIRPQITFQHDPDSLLRCSCSLMWHYKQRHNWCYNFRFLRPKYNTCPLISGGHSRDYRLSADDDIHVNDHEGCYVMQVVCPDFISIPSTMGLVLTKASLNISQGMRHHKLRLQFDQTFCVSDSGGSADVNIVIDPVLNLHILPWWHPKYTLVGESLEECPS